MKICKIKYIAIAAAVSSVPLALQAQDNSSDGWNHFGVDTHLGFNIHANFKNQGINPANFPAPPSAGGAVNRPYSDGFVNVDSTGNDGGLTENWGYQNASQISGNNLLLHANVIDGGSSTANNDPSTGFEVSYMRDISHATWGSWGIKFAFGYSTIDFKNNQPQTTAVNQVTDSYALGNIIVPQAPFAGSFSGPNAAIGSTPSRTSIPLPGGALITGNRELDATIYDFRVGPSADINLTDRLSLELGAGLALGVIDSSFSFNETTSSSLGTVSAAGKTHDYGFQAGAYGEASVAYRVWRSARLLAGLEFQYLGDFQQSTQGRTAQLDLGQTLFLKCGFEWRF
jgi:hypothetical protein